jgi:Cu(I)/Ag(I) efflux system membrane protein CusA/SilA
MIKSVIDFCARNRAVVIIATLFACAGAWYSIEHVALDAIPDLSDVQVIVWTDWMGRSPDLVEDQVTYPIVSALLGAPRVNSVRGYSMFGMSFVYAIFEDRTDPYWARSRVLEYLKEIESRLPPGVSPVLGPDATSVGWVFQYALVDKSGERDLSDLRTFQDFTLRYALSSVPGVAEVASVGGFQKQYQVEVDPERLVAYGLSIADVTRAIRSSNDDAGGRVIEMSGREYFVRGRGYIQDLEALRSVGLGRSASGTPILLGNVAKISFGPDIRRGAGDFDGIGEAVGGIVIMRHGENALDVIERVKAKIEEIEPSFPNGVEMKIVYDRSDLIRRAIDTLTRTLIEEGIVVAAIIVIFLLHLGTSLVPIIVLPVATLLAFIPMRLLGIDSNIMSLGGIAIAIGAMVDGCEVLVENAHKRLERAPLGSDRKEVIIESAKEVGPSIFFALLIISVAFLPIFALTGQAGRLFTPLAWTKTFAMFFGAVTAVTLAPALMTLFIRGKIRPEKDHPVSRFLIMLYRPFVWVALRNPKSTIAIGLAAVLSALPMVPQIGSEFMPPLNEGDILYMPTTFPNISLEEARQHMQYQNRVIRSFPEVTSVYGKAGRAETPTDPAPPSMLETIVRLKPREEWRKVSVERWYSGWAPESLKKALRPIWPERRTIMWQELVAEFDMAMQMPGWTNAWTMPIKTRIDMLSTGIRTPIGVKVLGHDLDEIERVGLELERSLSRISGTRSVYSERNTGGYFVDIVPDRAALARYGLTIQDVQDVIEMAIGGAPIEVTIEGRNRFTINVRYPRELRENVERLKDVLVAIPVLPGASATALALPEGRPHVPLGQIADVRVTTGPSMIKDEDGMLAGYVFIDIDQNARDIGSYVGEAKRAVQDEVDLPPGTHLKWTGQYELLESMARRMRVVIPITIILVVILLYVNFRNFTETLIVLISVPFALVGSIWLMYFLGYNYSTATLVGIIALIGLAAETGIVMILYLDHAYDERRRAGLMSSKEDVLAAVMEGSVMRLRPKLMTVGTTMIGLVPLLWATGTGADVMKRIAAPMVGGLVTSTFLTLEIIPVIYTYWRVRQMRRSTPMSNPRSDFDRKRL